MTSLEIIFILYLPMECSGWGSVLQQSGQSVLKCWSNLGCNADIFQGLKYEMVPMRIYTGNFKHIWKFCVYVCVWLYVK